MRAIVLNQRLLFQSDFSQPLPQPGESVIQVHLAGICGTDLELTRGYMDYSGVPGHEFVGHVVETGQPRLLGLRVVGEINAACHTCDYCIAGLGRHCPNRTVLGILGRDGAFADYLRLPDKNLLPVPDSIPDEIAVFTEPVAAAYEILEQVQIGRNQTIAILGDGRMGATVAMVLKAEGYEPLIAGHHEVKLQHLAALGFKVDLEKNFVPGFDVIVDCTGASKGFSRAAELLRPRGCLILKSTAAINAPMNLASIVVNEITVTGSRCGRFALAMAAFKEGKVDPRPLISATYPLERGLDAFAAAANSDNFKILLKVS